MIKLWFFILSFTASNLASASIVGVASRELSELLTPIVVKLSTPFTNNIVNNYPNIGYWVLSVFIAGVSLFFLLSSRNSKFLIAYRAIGFVLLGVAVFVISQPYI